MSHTFNSRQKAILNKIRQSGRVFVEDLSDLFETSPQTIRRDLQILADTGDVMRFHGGASLPVGAEYTGFDVRRTIAISEKEAIGKAVAAGIPNNTVVMINGGTTTAMVASALKNHAGLKVIVDNVSIANDLRVFPGIEVMVPCGTLRRSDGAILGEASVDFIRQFRADIGVIGAAALDASGALFDFDLGEVHVTRAIVECSKHVILAADSSKYGRSAPVCIGNLSQVHTLVTDRCNTPEIADMCARNNVALVEVTL